jgi:hypothetical protein
VALPSSVNPLNACFGQQLRAGTEAQHRTTSLEPTTPRLNGIDV